jgi:hypothetical protein
MESVRKWIWISAVCFFRMQDFCLYSLPKMYGSIEEMDQELHKGFLLISLIKNAWNHWGHGPGPHRGLQLILLIKNHGISESVRE